MLKHGYVPDKFGIGIEADIRPMGYQLGFLSIVDIYPSAGLVALYKVTRCRT